MQNLIEGEQVNITANKQHINDKMRSKRHAATKWIWPFRGARRCRRLRPQDSTATLIGHGGLSGANEKVRVLLFNFG